MDIEGTTTAIEFVHKTLFDYAKNHLDDFLQRYGEDQQVKEALDEAACRLKDEGLEVSPTDLSAMAHELKAWIAKDRKEPSLKKLQGFIWKEGYESQQFKTHLYPDVAPSWQKWLQAGYQLAIYSSGSEQAQKLLFQYTMDGDLTPYISYFFDTRVGGKQEPASYHNIAEHMDRLPSEIIFLSDIPEELVAANSAGLQTIHIVRPGTKAHIGFQGHGTFSDLPL